MYIYIVKLAYVDDNRKRKEREEHHMKKKNPQKNDTQNRRVQEIKYTTIIIIMNVNYNEEE